MKIWTERERLIQDHPFGSILRRWRNNLTHPRIETMNTLHYNICLRLVLRYDALLDTDTELMAMNTSISRPQTSALHGYHVNAVKYNDAG